MRHPVRKVCAATVLSILGAFAVLRADGNLLVGSVGTNSVMRYDKTTGAFVSAFVPVVASPNGFPEGLVFGPADGNLYVNAAVPNSVRRFNGTTGATIGNFVAPASGGLNGPDDLVFGPDGNLYVVSFRNHSVLRYNGANGAFMDAFVPTGSGGLFHPEGLTFGPDGNLYVTNAFDSSVLRYNGQTGAFLGAFVTANSGGLVTPVGIRFGPDGNFYVVSQGNHSVLRYNGTTGAFLNVFVTSGSGGLNNPRGMIFREDGRLYITSVDPAAVQRYNGTTGAFVDTFVSVGSGGLSFATFLTFMDSASKFWVGLKNSDDVGTQFDLKTDILVNSSVVQSGITRCITNLTRNPDLAKAVSSPVTEGPIVAGSGSTVAVRLSARIGTNGDNTKCSGPGGSHNSAAGLRLYYDSVSQASRANLQIVPNPETPRYLHSDGGSCTSVESAGVTNRFLNTTSPVAAASKCKDSGVVNFAGGNLWKEIGTWSETLP